MTASALRAILLLLACAACVSCRTTPPGDARPADARPSRALSGDAVTLPPGLDAAALAPRRGDELARARLSLEQILEQIREPDYLKPDPDAPESDAPISLPVQRAYLEGRLAWREGRNFDAVQALQRALRLAPNQPQILRLLGKIYTTSGNRIRGAQLLEQAIRVDPTHVESLVLLAMHLQDQGQSTDAIAVLARADALASRQDDEDPALAPMTHFYLGNALEREGYDQAAIQQYRRFLALPRSFGRSTSFIRELAFLYAQRGPTWQTVGDLHHRLGESQQAIDAYQQALDEGTNDPLAVVARVMYVHLRRGEATAARDVALQLARQGPDQPRVIALLRYLADMGAATPEFAAALESIYRDRDRPRELALLIADLYPPAQADALLRSHLAAKPGDGQVYRRLIESQWRGGGEAGPADAVVTTVAAIDANPATARAYVEALIDVAGSPGAVIKRIEALSQTTRQSAAMDYLHGAALLRAGRVAEARDALSRAMATDPRLLDARVELAALLINEGRFDEAGQLLDAVGPTADRDVIGLRVRVLSETGRSGEAMALLDEQIAADPTNLALVLDKATLQIRAGESTGAERTLLDALNLRPTEERLYEALLNLYDSEARPPDWEQQYRRVMRRLLGTMPNSRIARLQRAALHDARGEFREAQTLLSALLQENPDDLKALDALLETLVRAQKRPEADALIQQRLAARPQDRSLLLLAHRHYMRVGDQAKVLGVVEQLLTLEPDSPDKQRRLALVYLETDRPDKAVDALLASIDAPQENPRGFISVLGRALAATNRADEADPHIRRFIERHPEHEADLMFEWAMVSSRLDRPQQSEAIMLQTLEKHRDHAPTLNGLGYQWADQGRNLDRAQEMIQRAVDADPNAAYLDSLGWVYYKRGRFEEAVTWLQRANNEPDGGPHPVILDHLGDAYYRLGDAKKAATFWRSAQQALAQTEDRETDPELRGMEERLKAKLDAVAADRPAPVAALAEGVELAAPVEAAGRPEEAAADPAEALAP